ncbi:MAG: hypothetical protein J5850_04115, partial [Clostridia bacterium]|nr:hypothetical protein [Clostridia bacterium]
MFISKLTSSMEKAFYDNHPNQFPDYYSCLSLQNMQNSLQLVYLEDNMNNPDKYWAEISLSGDLARYTSLRRVECIPSRMVVLRAHIDDQFLRLAPGLYPDLVSPLHHEDHLMVVPGQCGSLWIDIILPEN